MEGVLTRTVADAASILDVISHPDPLSWYNAPVPVRPYGREVGADPGHLRIGLVDTAPLGLPMDQECVDAVRRTGAMLSDLGHDVQPAEMHVPDEALMAFMNIVNSGLADYADVDWDVTEPHIRANRQSALDVDSLLYVGSVHHLQRYSRQEVARWGRDFDVLLTPTLAILPPKVGILEEVHAAPEAPSLTVFQMAVFNAFFNITGQPSISLPLHQSSGGLPIGMQLVGGPWQEDVLVRLAAQLEKAHPWADRRPQL